MNACLSLCLYEKSFKKKYNHDPDIPNLAPFTSRSMAALHDNRARACIEAVHAVIPLYDVLIRPAPSLCGFNKGTIVK